MIDKNKTYTTRKGQEVKIYEIQKAGEFPVHGAYKDFDGVWEGCSWMRDGHAFDDFFPTAKDLIEEITT